MKTKIFFLFALISVVMILSSCESESGRRVREMKNNTEKIRVPTLNHDSLSIRVENAKYLKEELERMQNLISRMEKDPLFYLLVLDAELLAVENGEEVYGGFTDYFVPTMLIALKAGIPRVEIQKRINKLNRLANRGLFISSYQEELFKKGGNEAIVKYIIDNALNQ